MSVLLTIGFPVYNDHEGLWASLQTLGAFHHPHVKSCNLLVVNDHVAGADREAVENLTKHCEHFNSVKYLENPQHLGPARSKDRIFKEADTEWVLCMDSHVILPQRVLERTLNFIFSNPTALDLFQGPILYNNLRSFDTHWEPTWRGEMWGTWAGDPRGGKESNPPFEIFGNGCGLMLCRKVAWPGINSAIYGFGGSEELIIQEQFRQKGHKTYCLPFLRWNHYFAPKKSFPMGRYHKVRNYVISFIDLKMDLAPIYKHFVSLDHEGQSLEEHLQFEHSISLKDIRRSSLEQLQAIHSSKKITEAEWEFLLKDPYKHLHSPRTRSTSGGIGQSVESHYQKAVHTERDLNKHMGKISEVAAKCSSIEEVTRRVESSLALMVARPKFMKTFVYGPDAANPVYGDVMEYAKRNDVIFSLSKTGDYYFREIGECDAFFFKCPHDYHTMEEDLPKWASKVSRYIVIHDTATHADKWADGDGGIGLAPGIIAFLQSHKDWFVHYHSVDQYGLTILSKNEADRPPKELHPWALGHGPGTELRNILSSLGVTEKPGCDCVAKANMMDDWGVEGCKAKREALIQIMREGAARWSWSSQLPTSENWGNLVNKLKVAGNAILSGLFVKFSPLDPWPGLIDEAIRLAEEKETIDSLELPLLEPKDLNWWSHSMLPPPTSLSADSETIIEGEPIIRKKP